MLLFRQHSTNLDIFDRGDKLYNVTVINICWSQGRELFLKTQKMSVKVDTEISFPLAFPNWYI